MFKKTLIVGLLALSFVVAPVAHAQTAADLQAQISKILEQIKVLQGAISAQGGTAGSLPAVSGSTSSSSQFSQTTTCFTFTRSLSVGVRAGDDTQALNRILANIGLYEGNGGADYDEDTAAAVIDFQGKHEIRKTGTVGPLTRAKLNSLYGCNLSSTNTTQTTSNSSTGSGSVSIASWVVGNTNDGTQIDYTFAPSTVASWKITTICTSPVTASVKGGSECGETTTVTLSSLPWRIIFKNPTSSYQTVGVKVQGYDANGNLVGSAFNTTNILPTNVPVNPLPVISGVDGKATGTFEVNSGYRAVISGSYMKNVARAFVGGEPARVVQTSDTSVDIMVPSNLSIGSTYDLYVATDKGTSNVVRVKVVGNINTVPTITAVSPAAGIADGVSYVQIAGTGFTSSMVVVLVGRGDDGLGHDTSFRPTSVVGGTMISFQIPTSIKAGTYSLSVTDYNKTGSNAVSFRVNAVQNTSVQPSITVTSPNGGERLSTDGSVTINWSQRGDLPSSFYYFIYLKERNSQILGGTVSNPYVALLFRTRNTAVSGSSYTATLKGVQPGTYYIEVDVADENGRVIATDTSDSAFSVVAPTANNTVVLPSIVVTSPNGGETYKAGDTITVRWNSTNLPAGNVDIQLFRLGQRVLTYADTPNDGSENITLTSSVVTAGGSDYMINVNYPVGEAATYIDYSNAGFTILIPTTATAAPVTDTVALGSVVIDGTLLKVNYSKNFGTCAHLLNETGALLHSNNLFCTSGTNVQATPSLLGFTSLTAGTRVKLCNGNNYNICSPFVVVTAASGSEGISVASQPAPTPLPVGASVPGFDSARSGTNAMTANILSTKTDKSGQWSQFSANGSADWNWNLAFNVTSAKTIRSILVTNTAAGEAWSTDNSGYYPLIVFKDGSQQNTSYGATVALPSGISSLLVYGNQGGAVFSGGRVTVSFTDGTSLSADIAAPTSSATSQLASVLESMRVLLEGLKNQAN